MGSTYTGLIQRDGDWWIGWVKEHSGFNSQGKSKKELLENLQSALEESLQMNCEEAEAAVAGEYEDLILTV